MILEWKIQLSEDGGWRRRERMDRLKADPGQQGDDKRDAEGGSMGPTIRIWKVCGQRIRDSGHKLMH
jgi:hypothetical protein